MGTYIDRITKKWRIKLWVGIDIGVGITNLFAKQCKSKIQYAIRTSPCFESGKNMNSNVLSYCKPKRTPESTSV